MKNTVEYTADKRVSSATVELLIAERSKGKSLRQLGQMFDRSPERVRQILAKHGSPQVRLLSEKGTADRLGYPCTWLARLRKEGIINPINPGGFWLYSEEQVRLISSLIAETRKCERCGKPRPPSSRRFCRECKQWRKKHYYERLSPEAKAEHIKRCLAWQEANPDGTKRKVND